jgi:hypothetical protein
MKLEILIFGVLMAIFTGCAQTQKIGRSPLNLPHPEPLTMKPVEWSIIPDNLTGTQKDKTVPFIALTEDGYKNLAENFRNATNFIGLQRKVIEKYKNYYESEK